MNKLKLSLAIASIGTLATIASCANMKEQRAEKPIQDCSSIFETRYIKDGKVTTTNPKKSKNSAASNANEKDNSGQNVEEQAVTECKVLEVKIDDNFKCEIVGSGKIDSLTKILGENKSDKIILVAPEAKFRDLAQLAQKYLNSNGIELDKLFKSGLLKSLDFPYKGMKCNVSNKEFVVWLGDERLILTIDGL